MFGFVGVPDHVLFREVAGRRMVAANLFAVIVGWVFEEVFGATGLVPFPRRSVLDSLKLWSDSSLGENSAAFPLSVSLFRRRCFLFLVRPGLLVLWFFFVDDRVCRFCFAMVKFGRWR